MRKSWKEAGLILLNFASAVVVIIAAQPLLHKTLPDAAGSAVLALLVFATFLAGFRWIERRPLSELLPKRLLPGAAVGFALGLLLFSSVMALLWAAKVYLPSGRGTIHGIATGLLASLVAGVVEETLFRGLLFRLFAKLLGTWGALIITSGFFGLAHAFNPGATVSSSLAIALEAGILLGAAYAATKSLWVPIGLHTAWNFAEGSIFSMSVSGFNTKAGLILGSLKGPTILTGGQFGPEASIVAVIVCLAAATFFLRLIITTHAAEPPIWRKPQLS